MMMRAMVCCLEEDSGPLPVSAKFSLPLWVQMNVRVLSRALANCTSAVVTSLHEVEEIWDHRRELRNKGKQDCFRYEGPRSWTSNWTSRDINRFL